MQLLSHWRHAPSSMRRSSSSSRRRRKTRVPRVADRLTSRPLGAPAMVGTARRLGRILRRQHWQLLHSPIQSTHSKAQRSAQQRRAAFQAAHLRTACAAAPGAPTRRAPRGGGPDPTQRTPSSAAGRPCSIGQHALGSVGVLHGKGARGMQRWQGRLALPSVATHRREWLNGQVFFSSTISYREGPSSREPGCTAPLLPPSPKLLLLPLAAAPGSLPARRTRSIRPSMSQEGTLPAAAAAPAAVPAAGAATGAGGAA